MTNDDLKSLVDGYKPKPEVLAGMGSIRVLGTVGPSASGKTTIMDALVKALANFKPILDETSRLPRPTEVNGVDFLFRTKEEILTDAEAGNLVQVAIGPNGDLYCTRMGSYPSDAVGVIALVPPAVKEFRLLPIKSFQAAFIVPYSFESWQQWLAKQAKNGSWSQEKLAGRLAEAKTSYEFALSDKQIRFVLNDAVNSATKRLEQIVAGQPLEDEKRAQKTAEANYAKLLKLLNKSSSL